MNNNSADILIKKQSFDQFQVELYRDCESIKLFCQIVSIDSATKSTLLTDKIIECVNSAGIESDILQLSLLENLIETVRLKGSAPKRLIGKGTVPVAGNDGHIVWLVRPLTEITDGNSTLHVNRFFENIEEGQEIARVFPPVAGTSGKNIFGEVKLPEKTEEVKYRYDSSIEKRTSKEGLSDSLFSLVRGYLEKDEKSVCSVKPHLKLTQPITVQSGSVEFCGDLSLHSAVGSGSLLSIKAHGSLLIEQGAQEVHLAAYGDMTLKAPFIGINPYEAVENEGNYHLAQGDEVAIDLECQSSCKCDLLQSVAAQVKQDLTVTKEIRNCFVEVGGQLSAKKGTILGGLTIAPNGIEVYNLGGEAEILTIVSLDASAGTLGKIATLSAQIQQLEEAQELISVRIGPILGNPNSLANFSAAQREKVQTLIEKLEKIKLTLEVKHLEKEALFNYAPDNSIPQLNVLGTLFPGVVVQTKNTLFKCRTLQAGPLTISVNDEDEKEGGNLEVVKYRTLPKRISDV